MMTPRNPARMPLKEKVLLDSLAAVAALGGMWLATPDANGAPEPVPVPHLGADNTPACPGPGNSGVVCDPLVFVFGVVPPESYTPTSWQDMLLPEGFA